MITASDCWPGVSVGVALYARWSTFRMDGGFPASAPDDQHREGHIDRVEGQRLKLTARRVKHDRQNLNRQWKRYPVSPKGDLAPLTPDLLRLDLAFRSTAARSLTTAH